MKTRRFGGPAVKSKAGRRADLGDIFFRSKMEANVARYLNLLIRHGDIAKWEFEPETFWFEGIRRGVCSYKPDFKITTKAGSVYYLETKGFMDKKSATKLKRMKKYHPSVKVEVMDDKRYRAIAKQVAPLIPGWE